MSRDASSCRTLWGTVLFELRKSPPLLAGMTLGTVGYSVGHAALAFGAGSLAAALSGAPSAWADDFLGPVMTPAYVGLGGAIVKASGGTVLTHAERTLAARGATEIRLRTLEKLLESGGRVPPPKVLAALVVRLREVTISSG